MVFTSFGNRDIFPYIYKDLRDNRKSFSEAKKLKDHLTDKYYRVLTKVKLNKIAVASRKDWLVNNSRCSEILDSEFYYQMLPSLDMAVYDIDQNFLKEREIKAIDTMKPDSRYTNMLSIGFSIPRKEYLERGDYKNKYGCSKGVTKNETLLISPNKCVSYGKVKSYGSITTLVNCVGSGA